MESLSTRGAKPSAHLPSVALTDLTSQASHWAFTFSYQSCSNNICFSLHVPQQWEWDDNLSTHEFNVGAACFERKSCALCDSSSSRACEVRGVIKVTIKQEAAVSPSVTRAAVWGRNLFSFALPLPECSLIGVTAAIPEPCWCNRARSGPQPAPVPQGVAAEMDWLTLQVHFHVNVLALAPVNTGSVICTVLHVWWHTQWATAPKLQLFWSGGLAVSVDAKSRLECYCSSCIWETPQNNKNR